MSNSHAQECEIPTDARFQKHIEGTCRGRHLDCRPKGLFAEVFMETIGPKIDSAELWHKAMNGDLGAQHKALFADLVSSLTDPWAKDCSSPIANMGLIGLRGLGYMGAKDKAHLLTPLLEASSTEALSKENRGGARKYRGEVIKTLWHIGAKNSASKVAAALGTDLLDADARRLALHVLHQWDSDAGVDYCVKLLDNEYEDLPSQAQHNASHVDGAQHLMQRNHTSTSASDVIASQYSTYGTNGVVGIRALGRLGNASTVVSELRSNIIEEETLRDGRKLYNQGKANETVALWNANHGPAKQIIKKILSYRFTSDNSNNVGHTRVASDLVRELIWVKESHVRDTLALLKKWERTLSSADDFDDDHAYVVGVQAALGERSAVQNIVSIINAPRERPRDIMLDYLGDKFGTTNTECGACVIGHPDIVKALLARFLLDASYSGPRRLLEAAANSRAAVLAKK